MLEVPFEDFGIHNEQSQEQNEQPQEQNENSVKQNEGQNENSVEQNEAQFINGCRVLTLFGDELLSSDCVARAIRGTFKARIDPLGSCWADVSLATKALYFEEFRKVYYWEEGMEARVHKAWNKKAAKRYSDMLSKARSENKKPDCVPQNIWEGWREIRKTPKHQRISDEIRGNR